MVTQTEEQFLENIHRLHVLPDSNDLLPIWDSVLLAGAHFYGVSFVMQEASPFDKQLSLARRSTKSFADDFLVAQFTLDRSTAHHAMNQHTHHNLRIVPLSVDDMIARYESFARSELYEQYAMVMKLTTPK